MVKGIGVDIIEIDRVRRSIERMGDRFLEKVYTSREIATATRRRTGSSTTPPGLRRKRL